MTKLEEFSTFEGIEVVNDEIIVSKDIPEIALLGFLKCFFDFEIENDQTFQLNLKNTTTQNKISAFKYALTRDDIIDARMILNLFNLVKIYNTLDDSYFKCDDIFINDIEELLDVKLELQSELKTFAKTISIYFLSLFKSYNKVTYTPLDEHMELPRMYSIMFMSSDLLTLSGIFSISDNFSISDCKYIDGAFVYLKDLINKSAIGDSLIMKFMEGFKNGNIQ